MTSEDLHVTIDIAAPPADVWKLVSDVRRMGEWSTECRKVFVWRRGGRVRRGTWITGINKAGWIIWPTSAKVFVHDTDRAIGWNVLESGARWTYRLEYVGGVTRVTESRELPDGKTWIANVFARTALGGDENHDRHLRRGMEKTLLRIKAEVESGPS
jgi:uncharacterized protein YndB with AHSA1/START domain